MPAGLEAIDMTTTRRRPLLREGGAETPSDLTEVMARIEAICRDAKLRACRGSRWEREAPVNPNPE